MKNLKSARFSLLAAVLLGTIGLSACTTIGYRCPLDTDEDSEYPTACSSMQEAMSGARKGTGGKTSVLMDDKGRLVPAELLENKVAKPLAAQGKEPYRTKSGDPVFHQPKVFQVWTGAFVDAEGNLHDGHTSWFSTPGRWAYGTVDRPTDVGNNTMRPALPDTRPTGRVVKVDPRTGNAVPAQQQSAPQSAQERDKAALQNLSSAANSAAANAKAQSQPQPQVTAKPATAAPGVTAPAVGLSD
ncbi:hypothetical protein WJ96_04045 [Burkholderia ubonensis]|uniref:Type IV conjugative transfer system protein TraV n=1 Tax=Burkholderia ubonensis TaxID=101571 RepID=A0AAW3MT22_9BURK|nr:TraV family lipoprotein [Burkholderia ubonensis]KVP65547.1 hypothetical protein WJ93_23790 [Burkholderia ubonensis]KVP97747.1 hypothetical protein WJ96_04045 [Burkholderia ubonensis]KVZ92444.1 hypothetical protein WL25_15700 [Burkholderia ubonensis]